MSDELIDALREKYPGYEGPRTSALFRLIGALWNGGVDLSKRAIEGADTYAKTGDPSEVVGPAAETAVNMFGIGGPAAMLSKGVSLGAAGGRATAAALGGELPSGRAAVPSLRGLPRDEAIAIARTEPHLLPAGKGDLGAYRGGPESIKGPEDLAARRDYFDKYVAADPRGGDWYDRYRAAVNE